MGNSALGFLVGLGIDASEAKDALKQFESATGQSFGGARHHTEELDKTLLNAHQSTHLLLEEFGIRLPRAVVGAIGEILPNIATLGGGILGAFALDEVMKFGEYVKQDSEAVEGLAQAESHMKEAIQENLAAFKNFTSAQLHVELERTEIRIAEEEREFQHARRTAENEAALLPGIWHLYDKLFQTHVKEHEEETRGVLEKDMALAKQLTGFLGEANEKANTAAEKAARAQAKLNEEWETGTKKLAVFGPSLKQLSGHLAMDKATADALNNWRKAWEDTVEWGRKYVEVMPMVQQHTEGLIEVVPQVNYVLHEEESALKAVGQAMQADTVAQGEQFAAGLAGLVAGRKAQAAVEVVWETAQGIAKLAEGTWPPNPAAIIAAGLHFEAAAQYAVMAGRSAPRAGGAGGSGGRIGSSRGGYGGDGSADRGGSPLPGTQASGAAGPGGRSLSILVVGDYEAGKWLAGTLNRAVDNGIDLKATRSIRGAPVGH